MFGAEGLIFGVKGETVRSGSDMNGNFAAVVDGILKLSLEEKEELRSLLDKYLIEARREEILDNFQATRKEEEQGKLKTRGIR